MDNENKTPKIDLGLNNEVDNKLDLQESSSVNSPLQGGLTNDTSNSNVFTNESVNTLNNTANSSIELGSVLTTNTVTESEKESSTINEPFVIPMPTMPNSDGITVETESNVVSNENVEPTPIPTEVPVETESNVVPNENVENVPVEQPTSEVVTPELSNQDQAIDNNVMNQDVVEPTPIPTEVPVEIEPNVVSNENTENIPVEQPTSEVVNLELSNQSQVVDNNVMNQDVVEPTPIPTEVPVETESTVVSNENTENIPVEQPTSEVVTPKLPNQAQAMDNNVINQDVVEPTPIPMEVPVETESTVVPNENVENTPLEQPKPETVSPELPNQAQVMDNNVMNQNVVEPTPIPTEVPVNEPVQESPVINNIGISLDGNNNIINENNINEEKKTNKKSNLIIIIIGIVLLLAGLCAAYYFLFQNPTRIFKNAITDAFEDLNEYVIDMNKHMKQFDMENNPVNVDIGLGFETNYDEYKDVINNVNLNLISAVDYKEKLVQVSGSVKGTNEKILGLIQFDENKGYVKSNLFDDVLYVDMKDKVPFDEFKKEIDLINKYDEKNSDLNKTKNALINSLNKDFMTKEYAKEKINNKEMFVTKYSYDINDKSAKVIREELSKIEKFSFLKEQEGSVDPGKIIVYTSGILNEVIGVKVINMDDKLSIFNANDKVEIIFTDKTLDKNNKPTFSYDYKMIYDEKTKIGEIKSSGKTIATFKINELDDDKINIVVDYNKTKYELNLTIKNNDKVIAINGFVRIESDKKYLKVNFKYNVDTNKKIEKFDYSNAIPIDYLDEEQVKEKFYSIARNDEFFHTMYNIFQLNSNLNPNNEYEPVF